MDCTTKRKPDPGVGRRNSWRKEETISCGIHKYTDGSVVSFAIELIQSLLQRERRVTMGFWYKWGIREENYDKWC